MEDDKKPHLSFLASMLESKTYCDLMLICQGEKFPVHKAIVCPQSRVLAAACDGNFQEAASNVIQVTNFEPQTLRYMIDFLYKGAYEIPDADTDEYWLTPKEAVVPHVLVHSIANYYYLPVLLEQTNQKIRKAMSADYKSMEGLAEVIEIATQCFNDKGILELMMSATVDHTPELLDQKEFADSDLLNPFTLGVIRRMDQERREQNERFEMLQAESKAFMADVECIVDDLVANDPACSLPEDLEENQSYREELYRKLRGECHRFYRYVED